MHAVHRRRSLPNGRRGHQRSAPDCPRDRSARKPLRRRPSLHRPIHHFGHCQSCPAQAAPRRTADSAPNTPRRASGHELIEVAQKAWDYGMNRAPGVTADGSDVVLEVTYNNGRADRLVVQPGAEFVLLPILVDTFYNEPWIPPYFRCRILAGDGRQELLSFLDVPAPEFEALAPAIEPIEGAGPFVYPKCRQEYLISDGTYSLACDGGQESVSGEDLAANVVSLRDAW